MPILARINVTSARTQIAVDLDRRRLDFASIDGENILDLGNSSFVVQSGITGLRVPPRQVTTQEFPGLDGARLSQVATSAREVVIPLFVASDEGVGPHLRQLAEVRSFMDYRSVDYGLNEGTLDLVASQQDGTTRTLRCIYVDGMEGAEGASAGSGGNWSIFDVKLLAVNPYWYGKGWTTPTVSLPESNPFLANDAPAHPLRLSSTVALGTDMPVFVPGDVPSSPIVELIGPATTTHITSSSGLDVTIGSLTTGQLFVLDTGRNRAATLDGVSAWNKVGTSPRFRPLAPGGTTISIEMTGATADSRARVYGDALWETAW